MTLTNQTYWRIGMTFFVIACLSLASALLFQVHVGKIPGWYQVFDISFYYFIPWILWLIYIPLIFKAASRWPFSGSHGPGNLFRHVLIVLAFAPLSRLLAITLDFWLKIQLDMVHGSLVDILWSVRWVVVASLPKEILLYAIVIVIHYLIYRKSQPDHDLQRHQIIVRGVKENTIVPLDSIQWVEADKNYVLIHTDARDIRARMTLSALMGQLDDQFFRVHRSYIVNKSKITGWLKWKNGEYLLELQDGARVFTTRTFLPDINALVEHGIRPSVA